MPKSVLIAPWPPDTISAVDSMSINSYQFLPLEADRRCLSQFLQPHIWLIQLTEIVISILSIFLNSVSGVSTFYAVAIPFSIRRTFAIISLNYAFLAAICLAKKCFLLMSVYYPCISISSTLSCKLQEFPILLVYLHSAILPLTFAAQIFSFRQGATKKTFEGRRVRKSCRSNSYEFAIGTFDWTRCCSMQEAIVLIFCMCFSLYFTAFDSELGNKFLKKCSILMAIKDRGTAFCLVTLLAVLHLLAAILWPILSKAAGRHFKIASEVCETNLCNDSYSETPTIPVAQEMSPLCKIANTKRPLSKSANKLPAIAEEGSSILLEMSGPAAISSEVNARHFVHVGQWQSRRTFRATDDAKFRQKIAFSYLKLSFRDVLIYEAVFWLLSLVLAGLAVIWQFVVRGVCSKCIFLAVELSFTFFPLLIALSHAPLCMWLVLPIRRAAVQIFPTLMGRMLPSMEPRTPPLPRRVDESPSHNDETSSSNSSAQFPPSSVKILVTRYDGNDSPSSTTSILSGRMRA